MLEDLREFRSLGSKKVKSQKRGLFFFGGVGDKGFGSKDSNSEEEGFEGSQGRVSSGWMEKRTECRVCRDLGQRALDQE